MTRHKKATLRSHWWQSYYKTIRYCYRCGHCLKVRTVPAEMRRRHVCAKCGEITYVNPKLVAGLIPVLPDGRVILLRRNIEPAFGKWTYPAGFQEIGETGEEAALREVKEEIGVQAEVKQFLGIYSYRDAGVVTIVYIGEVGKSERPRLTEEAMEIGVFDKSAVPWKNLAFRSTREALEDWKKSL